MAPKTKEEQTTMALNAELRRLGVQSRLHGAPAMHLHSIGVLGRQQHDKTMAACSSLTELAQLFPIDSPEAQKLRGMASELSGDSKINPYTHTMFTHDDHLRRRTLRGRLMYTHNAEGLVFTDKPAWEAMLRQYFLPIHWPELETSSNFELWREVVPAITVAAPSPEIFEAQRWLHDEEAQRSAETLRYRLEQRGELPEVVSTGGVNAQTGQAFTATVIEKLRQGADVRRWIRSARKGN